MTRDATPYPVTVPAVEAIVHPALDGDDDTATRQCGRCRMTFQADPALDVRAREEWWLCPACEASLLPNRAKKQSKVAEQSNVIAFPRPLQARARDQG